MVIPQRWYPTKWTSGMPETECGIGSTTTHVREVAPYLALLLQDKTILELGCGDLNFARLYVQDWEKYTGYDVCRRSTWPKYENKKAKLYQCDVTRVHAFQPYDACVMRDFLIHLPTDDCKGIIEKVKRTCSMIIATHYPVANNARRMTIPCNQYQPIDMTEFLGKPYGAVPERTPGKFLCIWRF